MPEAIAEQPVRIEDVVTLTEAGRRAELTTERMRQLVDRGDIRGVWVGGRRMIVRSDFERWLCERKKR